MDVGQLSQSQRIEERRARIQKRKGNESAALDSASSQLEATAGQPENKCEAQAMQALGAMAGACADATEAISAIGVAADSHENRRRARAEARMARNHEMHTEGQEASEVKLLAIEGQFAALYKHTVPRHLSAALEAQRSECTALLAAKEAILNELEIQLEQKEEEYVRHMQQSDADITQLIEKMHEVTADTLSRYVAELKKTESEYEDERQKRLTRHAEEIMQLVKTRRTKETDYRRRREQALQEAQARLDEKYEDGNEEYHTVKVAQQGEIHALREELEKCKADFMVNEERLNYNLQVLRERIKENRGVQARYKRRLAKLQGALSALLARHQEADRRYQRANKDLTSQLHRVDGQYRDLQKKFLIFERADREKYRQLWNMHNRKAKKLAHQALQADRVVFEDILHAPWAPPELQCWSQTSTNAVGTSAQADAALGEVREDEDAQPRGPELDEAAQMLLHILRTQASFLVDDNVYAAIKQVEGTTEEQAAVEAILTTLQITKNEEVQDLLEYFIVDGDDGGAALINPQEAVHALNTFLEDRHVQQQQQQKAAEQAANATQTSSQASKVDQAAQDHAAGKAYWQRLAQAVPKSHLQLWGALEKGLEQYLVQLQQRKDLIAATDALRWQNDELRGLAAQYASSDINYQLYAPPKLALHTPSM